MSNSNHVLLLWWSVPEELDVYLIPDPPAWLTRCHRHYINALGTDPEVEVLLSRVADAICSEPGDYVNALDELAGAWVAHKLDLQKPENVPEAEIILCGFFM